ncbi:maltokinase N-terminal cap-like domain-containing protein [Uniformispora flossi]|uniref:maltokinase N-terminal cap-like domain-containing protein n=1 Tax=Uniformispora flossi TaxID=3390723 RepID=UPI003C2BD9CE
MAVIHHTTLIPTKFELLAAWLPGRSWYRGGPVPALVRVGGGFRLDDPAGEVGVEFAVVAETSGEGVVTYLVPMSYRGAPLEGGEGGLIGTMEHGVLGKRWAYDSLHDPVLVAELLALLGGRTEAQHQHLTDTAASGLVVASAGEAAIDAARFAGGRVEDGGDATVLTAPDGASLRLHRILASDDAAVFAELCETSGQAVATLTGRLGSVPRP